MRRLTTPTHRFTLQMGVETIDKIQITYAQGGVIVLQKSGENITMDGKSAVIRLTQEETKKFTADKEVEIQVRVLTIAGDALASEIIKVDVKRVLDEEVLV